MVNRFYIWKQQLRVRLASNAPTGQRLASISNLFKLDGQQAIEALSVII
jgi:hypothetical protein